MHFIFSDKVVLLFDFWSVHSPAGKNGKLCRSRPWRTHQLLAFSSLPALTCLSFVSRWFSCHFGQSLIHVAQVVISYFLMLAVMSYNTWIFLGVVLGSAVGYYLAYPLLSIN
ncbi:PREDICTED: probable low affinity copper uptake protein 2 [Hipposideros armiger]|uniref:Copper transport protein n=1 Tax=Hipposideros armiger TaxID=186990 RepID=A0A8B7QRQ4_HIPAR|nr:PREDICTED: probable low affinity copper uptake protein 2 [Hipposideros armiger]